MSGGGGGSKNTTQTTKVEPPPQLAPYLAPFMQQASAVAMTPYQQYGGQRIADFTADQLAGFDMTRNVASGSQSALARANQQVGATSAGDHLGYQPGTNDYLGAKTSVGQNALLGMNNPYLNQAIDAAHGDITRNFNNTIANNTDATFARAGAFGGSAWQQAQSENANQLAQNLGRVSNDMRMADYGLQAQLGEADIARRLNAEQTDLARNSALSQAGIELSDAAYQNERARMLQAAGMLPGMAQAGYTNAQALLGIGDAIQGQNQGQLDIAYQNWINQQNHPHQSLDVMANAIRTLMGGGGTTTATGPNPYQRSGTAAALGGALGGAGLASSLGASMGGAGLAGPWGLAAGAGLGLLGGIL